MFIYALGKIIQERRRDFHDYGSLEMQKKKKAAKFCFPALKGWAITTCPFKGANDNSPPFQRRVNVRIPFSCFSFHFASS